MSRHPAAWLWLLGTAACPVLVFSSGSGGMLHEQRLRPAGAAPLQMVCTSDRPVVHPAEKLSVRAWIVDGFGTAIAGSVNVAWTSSFGSIKGGASATWLFPLLSSLDGSPEPDRLEAVATGTAKHKESGEGSCKVLVYVAKQADPGTNPRGTLSARAFLTSANARPEGYGAYSYLLFRSPPRNEVERQRYLHAVASYLLILRASDELERHRRRSELNIVLVPIRQSTSLPEDFSDRQRVTQAAEQVLAVYDYARAEVLLDDLGAHERDGGPYLVTTAGSADQQRQALLFDMSHVVPSLVGDWVQAFCHLAAQERTWRDVTLAKLSLNMRNVLAVAARETPIVVASLKDWILFLKPR